MLHFSINAVNMFFILPRPAFCVFHYHTFHTLQMSTSHGRSFAGSSCGSLLLLDENNPRTVYSCMHSTHTYVHTRTYICSQGCPNPIQNILSVCNLHPSLSHGGNFTQNCLIAVSNDNQMNSMLSTQLHKQLAAPVLRYCSCKSRHFFFSSSYHTAAAVATATSGVEAGA